MNITGLFLKYLIPMKILIVDDEELARERLKDMIGEFHAGHHVLEAENGLVALKLAEKESPDVMLLDIRMPVMDGLETACHLSNFEQPPAIVFTTAYQDHAIEAFESNAVDYLLKPIRSERLEQALERAQIIQRARILSLRETDPDYDARRHLSSSSHGKIRLIPVVDIRYLKAEQKYVCAGWQEGEALIDESLKSLETEFSDRFIRIHRNALIAPEYIIALEKDKDGSHYIRLADIDERLAVSRRHLHHVRQLIKQKG